MSPKIIWLNVGLLALLGAGSWELRQRWLEAEKRRLEILAAKPKSSTPGATTPAQALPASAPLSAAQYFEVAERFLFSKDRNPTVVVEQAAAPPPPKPMPDLPNVFGVMNLGLGPTVFMSLGSSAQQSYKVGDQIGEFKLIAASSKEVSFQWQDQTITKPLDELVAASRAVSRDQNMAAAPPPPAPGRPDFTPEPPAKPPENVKPAPGNDIGMERKSCVPGDSSPAGTVVDGYKKVSYAYAFGPICYWERVR